MEEGHLQGHRANGRDGSGLLQVAHLPGAARMMSNLRFFPAIAALRSYGKTIAVLRSYGNTIAA